VPTFQSHSLLRGQANYFIKLTQTLFAQQQIASILQVGIGAVNRNLQYLMRLAKANISKHINKTLPLAYEICLIGLNAILSKTWDIANNPDSNEKDKLQAISVGMLYHMML
jgi:hypothetical protein